jgi:hypothetical protein
MHKVIYQIPGHGCFGFLRGVPSQLCFKKSMGPKNGLERRVWQFYTICDKNQRLKVKIDKVTAILVLGSSAGQQEATSGSALKFVLEYGALWWIFKKKTQL